MFIENNNTKSGKKGQKEKKELSRTRTQHLPPDATTANHCTTEVDYTS